MGDNLINVNVNLDKTSELVAFAKTLKKVIVEQKLFVNIQGKNYAVVEAWQFCGGAIKAFPVVTELTDLSTDNMIKYRAVVEIRRLDNQQVISSGFAICTNKEKGKQYFDEYAIASMAQTRAIGKAYRTSFGWLMKLAGYEATPAEEVQDTKYNATETKKEDIINAHTA
jgi:hypothetical protein